MGWERLKISKVEEVQEHEAKIEASFRIRERNVSETILEISSHKD
jgi:hypothetical protein